MRDIVEDGTELLSSQEMESIQDWLFLSSSQLDHLESPEECKFSEEKQAGNESSVESGASNSYFLYPSLKFDVITGNALEVTSSRKRAHPEP